MRKASVFPCALALCASLALSASTSPVDASSDAVGGNSAYLAVFADLVQETELRRRVNILFPNPQSLFDGLQIGYVGVRHGNLTFRRRDLVSAVNPLARIERVYDSRAAAGRDFGPGWRLALDESLTAKDAGLVYADGSGARHFFRLSAPEMSREQLVSGQSSAGLGRSSAMPPAGLLPGIYTAFPETPQHARASIEVAGPLAIFRNGGETRVFERAPSGSGGASGYRLTRADVADGSFIALSYRNGLLRRVSDAEGPVFELLRDHADRIYAVQDRWGREVRYSYLADGRLSEAVDAAGNAWSHEYGAGGNLTRAIGPNGRDILRIAYDEAGRVKESLSGREYSFDYGEGRTVVAEGTGHSPPVRAQRRRNHRPFRFHDRRLVAIEI